MKIESNKSQQNFPFIATAFVYTTGLYLYLLDFISGFFFVFVLLLMSVLLIVFLVIIKNTSLTKREFVISIILSLLLLIYETPIILVDNRHYFVSHYSEPEELIKDSRIFTLSVKVDEIGYVENEQVLRDSYIYRQIKFYEIIPATNVIRYSSKNLAIFELVGLVNNDFEQMSVNVKSYLKTNTAHPAIEEFLARDKSGGSSAGLALVISSLVEQGKLQNDVPIGVTGAISKTGKVTKVGSIKEKMLISNEHRFSHMIIPLANLNEAIDLNKTLNLPIEIIGVRDVDEAVEIINELNKK